MTRYLATAVIASMLAAASAQAQESVHWAAPLSPVQAAASAYFPLGTPLRLVTRTEVSTKENRPGDRVYLEVAEPLVYRGQVVLPAGSMAVGEIADVQRNGHFGKKGKLALHLLYVQTPGGPVRLGGRARDEGTSGTVVSIATMVLVSWTGMFIHGTSAHLPSGTPVEGYLAEDLRFAVQAPTPQVALRQVAPDGLASVTADPGRRLPAAFVPGGLRTQGVQTAVR